MTITEKLNKVTSVPMYATIAPIVMPPYAVYSYSRFPCDHGDDECNTDIYNVLINLYCKSGIESTKDNLIRDMENKGFVFNQCANTMLDATGYYNTPLTFKIYINREDN